MRDSRRVWRFGLIGSAAIAACQYAHGVFPPATTDTAIPDDSAVDTIPPPPDASGCQAVGASCANADTLRECTTVGVLPTDTKCAWGCATSGGAHCAVLSPAGGAITSADVQPGVNSSFADVVLTGTVDSANGAISGIRQAGEGVFSNISFQLVNNVAVFRMKSLRLGASVSLGGPYPVVFVVENAITVDGPVEVTNGCSGSSPGPGGGSGATAGNTASGSGGGAGSSSDDEGGGGGGYGGSGGTGAGNNNGGTTFGTAAIATLKGGGGGGGGGGGCSGANCRGGGGGGAVQLVSNREIIVTANGSINAGGCGGHSGAGGNDGGGGGGAGGTILFEAPRISIAGTLAVNGGGGGEGNGGNNGANATLSRARATGGGDGGAGGAGSNVTGAAGTGQGGGGGAVGRMRFNSLSGTVTVMGGALLSPNFQDSPTTATQAPASVQ